MSRVPLWKISLHVSGDALEAVMELFERILNVPCVSYHDLRTGRTTASSYLCQPSAWSDEMRAHLESGLAHVRSCGLDIGRGRITAVKIKSEDWAESWKRHFHAMEFGHALLVKPGWIRRRPRAGQKVVILDPGLSFGTGQHPTTGFCLKQIVAHRQPRAMQTFLDIGTGSGILAIAAAKLGYSSVTAFDFDPAAVRVARANARRNRVTRRIRITKCDLAAQPLRHVQKYDIVCANLIHDVLVAQRRRILNYLKPGGVLVLAGILQTQFEKVATVYKKAGIQLVESRKENEWRSGTFARAAAR
ncbi:MAG: ribosomal protein methyltransferase [Verrucomicrobiota bacterium]